jgi:hypothetical protein
MFSFTETCSLRRSWLWCCNKLLAGSLFQHHKTTAIETRKQEYALHKAPPCPEGVLEIGRPSSVVCPGGMRRMVVRLGRWTSHIAGRVPPDPRSGICTRWWPRSSGRDRSVVRPHYGPDRVRKHFDRDHDVGRFVLARPSRKGVSACAKPPSRSAASTSAALARA